MAAQTEITLGYGGSAFINVDGGKGQNLCWVFINSGGMSKTINVPNFLSYNMDFEEDRDVRNDVALGCGLFSFQGNLNFAITKKSLEKLFSEDFIKRHKPFDVYIYDGQHQLELKCCYWNSFTIQGNPKQVLTGSISFVSTNNQQDDFIISENPIDTYNGFHEELIKYWKTGNKYIETFFINFTKETTPVYLNTDKKTPAYIREGKINLSAQFSSWKKWEEFETKKIQISNKSLEFKGFPTKDSSSFNFEGIDDTGKYNYSIKLYNVSNSSKKPWIIL